jgi:hypothetical protein
VVCTDWFARHIDCCDRSAVSVNSGECRFAWESVLVPGINTGALDFHSAQVPNKHQSIKYWQSIMIEVVHRCDLWATRLQCPVQSCWTQAVAAMRGKESQCCNSQHLTSSA